MVQEAGPHVKAPVFLLKTRSSPSDAYEETFSAVSGDFQFEPRFVPVLEHRFDEGGLARLGYLLRDRQITTASGSSYGGLIFTSQRAVEAFTYVVKAGSIGAGEGWPHLQDVPVYSVGPATTRALQAVPQVPPLCVTGGHTGNGEALAKFILSDYGERYKTRSVKPALLFLVGEQRRDIIPKTLMSSDRTPEDRIQVDEDVVYGTGVMESFAHDFAAQLRETQDREIRWVVVFSPTGCESMLRTLDLLDEAGKARPKLAGRTTFIAAIGPTTRSFLAESFGLEPDVCAAEPSPEGVLRVITGFHQSI